jgi:hypothetical protein
VGPFGLGNGTFDNYMIDLPIVVSMLSLGIEIGVATSCNCEDCAVCGEGIRLWQRLLDLQWRWWWRWWVGFGLDLRFCVVWHWVCDLWHCQRVYYLWSWRRLRIVGYGIVI